MAISASQARWRATPAGRAARAAQNRRRRQRDPGMDRAWKKAHPLTPEERATQKLRHDHDIDPAELATMWNDHGGRCYLCGTKLDGRRRPDIDHDHSCCPQGKSCRYCRRGLCCRQCNVGIGMFGDDPDRMERVAAALRIAKLAAAERLATKPVQEMLLDAAR